MSEHQEEFMLEIEAKLFGLAVKELHQICEYCKISGKDSEDVKHKTHRALVKHIVKFCERDEFLEREDEGLSVLLELNKALNAQRENSAETDDVGVASLVAPPAADGGEEETARSAWHTSGRQLGDRVPFLPSLETQIARETARDYRTQSRDRDSGCNSCWPSSGFRKDFRINGHVADVATRELLT
ncbi:hypothetical protein JOB18_031126 [Solea senegalensis]|uniref:Uncharacterized protein n=1 Tax=Solea senegalensis TaxID=28829 RepID=A0AAV6RVP2_SOLSE|nr:hypothetical protein JOB18_031126 [Solea senegalensis]